MGIRPPTESEKRKGEKNPCGEILVPKTENEKAYISIAGTNKCVREKGHTGNHSLDGWVNE